MMEQRAEDILKRQEQLASDRAGWESHWQDIGDRVLPRQADFTHRRMDGAKRTELIFDATASIGLERFAAAMESMLTPRGGTWHTLRASDDDLNDIGEVQEYFDEVNKIMFARRYAPRANFASQQHEAYMSLGAFGTGILCVAEDEAGGLVYKSIHLGECYLAENHRGQIDTLYRKFELTARQAMLKFPRDLPDSIVRASEAEPDRKFEFVHAVYPRDERKLQRRDKANKPIASYYVSMEGRKLLGEGGFDEFPYMVSRYVTAPREVYGRSPAMTVLPDIKMLNEMSKTMIRQAHRMVDPPLLLADDGVLTKMNTRPGALNFGGIDDQGRMLVRPLETGGHLDVGDAIMEQRRKVINDAFLVTLFQILVQQPSMTATEALMRAQEKGALLGPTVGRQQSEALGPMIEREVGVLSRLGQLPPMPQALKEAAGEYRIEYESPLSKAQRAEEGVGISRTLEMVMPLVQADPSVIDNFDLDAIARAVADVQGIPKKLLRELRELDRLRERKAQMQQAQAMLQMAPMAADALQKTTQAGKNAKEAQHVPLG